MEEICTEVLSGALSVACSKRQGNSVKSTLNHFKRHSVVLLSLKLVLFSHKNEFRFLKNKSLCVPTSLSQNELTLPNKCSSWNVKRRKLNLSLLYCFWKDKLIITLFLPKWRTFVTIPKLKTFSSEICSGSIALILSKVMQEIAFNGRHHSGNNCNVSLDSAYSLDSNKGLNNIWMPFYM